MLLSVVGVGRAGPVHQVEIDVVHAKALEGRVDTLSNAVVPGVVQLRGDPDLIARNTGVPDTITDLGFVSIGKSTEKLSMEILKTSGKLSWRLTYQCDDNRRAGHS